VINIPEGPVPDYQTTTETGVSPILMIHVPSLCWRAAGEQGRSSGCSRRRLMNAGYEGEAEISFDAVGMLNVTGRKAIVASHRVLLHMAILNGNRFIT
jgi:hypothetical protein